MKRYFIRFLFLISVIVSDTIYSQQNFINVPSSEVTDSNKGFFQQQINFGTSSQFNSTFEYGLGKGFEIGCNVINFNYSFSKKGVISNDSVNSSHSLSPLIMMNGLKKIQLNQNSSLNLGFQTGVNVTKRSENIRSANLLYLNYKLENFLINESNIIIGTYYNSYHYGGKGNRIGCWFGMEIPLNQKFHIMGENSIGTSDLASSCIGLIYYPLPWVPLTFGWQFNHNQLSQSAFVFELTITPKKHIDHNSH